MTSIYSEDGQQFPATVIEAGPCVMFRRLKRMKMMGIMLYK